MAGATGSPRSSAGVRSVRLTFKDGRKEEMRDLQSTRVARISLLKRIIAQLIIVFSLRLVRIILSREGVVFYSYHEE
jgi:hypothetical protein